jgi:hypothetical protein
MTQRPNIKIGMPKKASMSKSKVKFMLVYFFDSMNIVHKQWVPAAQTAN